MIFKQRLIYFLDKLFYLFGKSIFRLEKFYVKRNLGKVKQPSDYEFVLIVGSPRSGTTLLQTILSTHPKIKSPQGEVDFSSTNFLEKSELFFGKIPNPKKYENKVIFLEKLFKKYAGKKKLLIKRPLAIFYLDLLWKYFPNMKIINLIRDGRGVVNSLTISRNFKWPYRFACKQWKASVAKRYKYRKHPNYYEVKYENIINKPEESINGIFDFLGLKKMTKKQITKFYEKLGNKNRKLYAKSDRPLSSSPMEKWKKNMTKKQKRIFKKIAGKTLIKLGYEKNNNW